MKFFNTLIVILGLTPAVWAQTVPANVDVQLDIVYKQKDNWEGKLDLYVPRGKSEKALIVYIHGGGWTHGKKEAEYDKIKVFIEHGYPVANIEYRLAAQAPAPAAVEDVHCAITYLLNHAKALGIAKKKLVVMGASAGGHLALLAALQTNRPTYTGDCNPQKFKVAGIISKYGPTDLLTWEPATKPGSGSSSWLGTRLTDTAFLQSLSPVNYVEGKKIPVLFVHGDEDKTVPIQQALKLYDILKQKGWPTELYIVKGGKHGNFGEVETPKMDAKMLEFVKRL